jgi:pimeloyl-ACP methyl ester carboxylesterase
MSKTTSIFKIPEYEERQYIVGYETVLALWSAPHKPLDVPTRFGTTHINTSGPENAPAMVLPPGFGTNSTTWFPNIAALSSRFRVYALDTIGQPEKSAPSGVLTARRDARFRRAGRP